MLSAADHLRQIEAHLLRTGGTFRSTYTDVTDPGDEIGSLRAILDFQSGHELHVALTVDAAPGYPLWTDYSFHLQAPGGSCVFRYDNAPHYRQLPSFPHHKHVGPQETPEEHLQPGIRDIVAEVALSVGNILQP